MLLSIYTSVKNGLFYDYHVVDMLKHHLPLADEIVVNDGFSTDGTYEKISTIDPKIKVFQSDWGKPTDLGWITRFKNDARSRCRGEWCINLDCDEFIPEWEFERLRDYLSQAEGPIVPIQYINFYANYKVYHTRPASLPWPDVKWNIHRNRPDVEVWGDGSNVRFPGFTPIGEAKFTCHHFGFVRHAARQRQKMRNILGNLYRKREGKKLRWFSLPSFLFNWFPHDWKDPQYLPGLAVHEGPYVRPVRDNPDEFIRDNFAMYHYLCKTQPSSSR